jgi:hypothetical protein
MKKVDRRSTLALGLAAASAAVVKPAAAQTGDALAGKETSPWPGVVIRTYGETPAMIPGFKTVSMRDIIMQPGSKTMGPPMPNPMVCHILEGEMHSMMVAWSRLCGSRISRREANASQLAQTESPAVAERGLLAHQKAGPGD